MPFNPNYNNLPAGSFQTFVSRPDLTPPLLNVNGNGTAGLVLFNQVGANVHQPGLIIADNTGEIVYVNDQVPAAYDFNVQTFNGQNVLTYWNGQVISTHSLGNYYIMDDTFNTIANISTAASTSGDLHEFNIINNTGLISFYYIESMNLTKWGGPANGFVYGSGFQQIDLNSRDVLFEWKSTDHVSPDASFAPIGGFNGDGTDGSTGGTGPWDYFHINSVDIHPTDGTFLISARHTSSIYQIANNSSGTIIWTMTGSGGKAAGNGDFFIGPKANFYWQHHARWHSATEMSIYDNGSQYRITVNETSSRGLRVSIDTSTAGNFTVSLIQELVNPAGPLSGSQGSLQYLANGNYWVGYGDICLFSEFDPSGQVISQYQLSPGGDVQAYRSFKVNYTTNPTTTPDIAIQNGTVYVSWNGATEVTQWNILSGATRNTLSLVETVPKTGFETSFTFAAPYNSAVNFTRVDALDASGTLLKSTQTKRGDFQSPLPRAHTSI